MLWYQLNILNKVKAFAFKVLLILSYNLCVGNILLLGLVKLLTSIYNASYNTGEPVVSSLGLGTSQSVRDIFERLSGFYGEIIWYSISGLFLQSHTSCHMNVVMENISLACSEVAWNWEYLKIVHLLIYVPLLHLVSSLCRPTLQICIFLWVKQMRERTRMQRDVWSPWCIALLTSITGYSRSILMFGTEMTHSQTVH